MPQLSRKSLPYALALTLCGLAGCGSTSTWEDRVQNLPPPARLSLTDGAYRGVAELVATNGPECPAGRPGIITIGDQRLIYPYTPRITFIAPINADGSLRANTDNATLEGLIGNGDLVFAVRTPTCESRYRLRWVM